MSNEITYMDYVSDAAHMKAYSDYQKKYARTMRESDKVLLDLVRGAVKDDVAQGKRPKLMDIGCSTGNFLYHVKNTLPGLDLVGADLVGDIIEKCRQNPDLKGIQFDVKDVVNLNISNEYDVIVTNAMLCVLSEKTYQAAVKNIGAALKKGGWLISFEWHHPFDQELEIVEKSQAHPQGLALYFRGYPSVTKLHVEAGFKEPTFRPFFVPIDLPKPKEVTDITTYTVKSQEGKNLSFRGTLYQPWCHLTAQKK